MFLFSSMYLCIGKYFELSNKNRFIETLVLQGDHKRRTLSNCLLHS